MEENQDNQTAQNLNPAPPVSPVLPTDQTPPAPPISNIEKRKPKFPLLIIGVVLFLLVIGSAAGFYFFSLKTAVKPASTPIVQKQTLSPTPTADPTADWKTHNGDNFSFKYPNNLFLKENEKNFLVLKKTAETPGNLAEISIDARLTGVFSEYDLAIGNIKKGLTDVSTKDFQNGIVIRGKMGPGMGEGTQVLTGLIKYNTGAIAIENSTNPLQEELLLQILSTFRLTNQADTANLKIYTNTKAGFQVKYPLRYSKPQLPSGAPGSQPLYADENSEGDILFGEASTDSFGIFVFSFAGSIQELLASSEAKGFPPYSWTAGGNISLTSKDIVVSNVNAKWITASYKTGVTDKYSSIFLVKGNYGLIIHTSPNHDENEISQILSTFKFTR